MDFHVFLKQGDVRYPEYYTLVSPLFGYINMEIAPSFGLSLSLLPVIFNATPTPDYRCCG